MRSGLTLLALLLLPAAAGAQTKPTPQDIEFFEKQVRPLLVENCLGCHGGGNKAPMGHLRLDTRAGLLQGGDRGPAFAANHPEESLLLKAVSYTRQGLQMPPKGKLTDAQIAILTDWIKRGAPWSEAKVAPTATPTGRVFDLKARKAAHWAWQPVKRPAIPAVKNRAWVTSPIDAFLLAKLEAKGIAPAPPADKRTLLRRVTYDLIGLPPTPAEIHDFLADTSPNAYAKVVDRLLASPHYGERWGRHWLDLVRYAETDGHEWDIEKPGAYQYRDYVIRAFNADVNYRQFVREQVAGDLLPSPRLNPTEHYNESVLGTGFYWLGAGQHSPVDLKDDHADHMDNEIDVFGKTFLGLGIGCARCHDHKFDAISSRDYYSLYGILSSTRKQIATVGPPLSPEVRKDLAAVNADLRRTLLQSVARTLASPPDFAQPLWKGALEAAKNDPNSPLSGWLALNALHDPAAFNRARTDLFKRLADQTERARNDEKAITWLERAPIHGVKSWAATGEAFDPDAAPGLNVRLAPQPAVHVAAAYTPGIADSGALSDKLQGGLRSRTFTIEKSHIVYRMAGHGARIRLIVDGLQTIRDPLYGGLAIEVNSDKLTWYTQDVHNWIGHEAYVEIQDADSGGYIAVDRIGFTENGPPTEVPNPLVVKLLSDPGITTPETLAHGYAALFAQVAQSASTGAVTDPDLRNLAEWALQALPLTSETAKQAADLMQRRTAQEGRIANLQPALAATDGTGENEKVHRRGNYRTLGDEAPRHFLEACDGDRNFADAEGCGRLELADRMTSPSDPLLARVMVNRIWQHHFGEGIVRTPDDFGVMGQRPTHPELLDWLASEFVRQGWSIKQMHRLMLLSSAYRMDSRADPKAEAADPQNLLVHRMPVRRLEAEAIRDAILAVSGRLDPTVYGPPVMPNLTSFTPGRGAPPSGPVDGAGRRSVYLSVRRNFPIPMLMAFDYPVPATTIGHRSVSSVPAQALTLLNDPFVVEQAGVWAKRILATPATPEQRISDLYETAFGRLPDAQELATALAFVSEGTKPSGNPNDLRTWTDLCHVLYNVKEFLFLR